MANFYPRPPRGGRRRARLGCCGSASISIHALREEGDWAKNLGIYAEPISIHALREEGDYPLGALQALHGHFYPRPPRGGRRTATDEQAFGYQISIHALREEGDHGKSK